jgi:cell division initiation protein
MRITPLDVRKQEFRKAVRGFDCDEVRAFLSTLADEYETVLVDNKQIRERLAEQDDKLAEYQKMEKNLRDTLMTAERVMQETKESAARKGEIIVQEAEMKARGILEECRLRTEELRREITGLRKEKETYLARFRSLAEAQIQFVDTHKSDFEDLDRRLTDIVDSVVTRTATAGNGRPAGHDQGGPANFGQPNFSQSTFSQPAAGQTAAPAAAAPAPENDIWRDYQPGADSTETASAPIETAAAPVNEPAAVAADETADTDLNGMLAEALTESAPSVAPAAAQPAAEPIGTPSDGPAYAAEAPETVVAVETGIEAETEKPVHGPGFGPGEGLEPVVTEIENI